MHYWRNLDVFYAFDGTWMRTPSLGDFAKILCSDRFCFTPRFEQSMALVFCLLLTSLQHQQMLHGGQQCSFSLLQWSSRVSCSNSSNPNQVRSSHLQNNIRVCLIKEHEQHRWLHDQHLYELWFPSWRIHSRHALSTLWRTNVMKRIYRAFRRYWVRFAGFPH